MGKFSIPTIPKIDIPIPNLKIDMPKINPKIDIPTPKIDGIKIDGIKIDAPKIDAPKIDAPKVDAPKVDTPKVDTPKVDSPKVDSPKVDDGDLDNIAKTEIGNFKAKPNSGKVIDDADGIKAGFKNGDEASSAANKLDNLLDSNPGFAAKIWNIVKKNPLKVGGAVLLTALGAYGLSMALKKFKENENKVVGITKSYKSDNNITIEFTPDATIVNNDKVLINDANFVESLNDQTLDVKKIIGNNKIEISSTTNVTKYADSGKITIKTTLENHILNQAEKGKELVKDGIEKVTSTAGNAAWGIFTTIYNTIKPYLIYFCGFILIIILIWIGIKFMIK